MESKEEQLQVLHDQITGKSKPTGNEKIMVFPIEAGLGKTTTAIEALSAIGFDSHKSIVVTKLIPEADLLGRKLGKLALVIHSSKRCKDHDTIENAPILVITHAKYIQLCRPENESIWELYSKGRSILIIDEEIQMVKMLSVSRHDYALTRNTVSEIDRNLVPKFDRIFAPLLKQLKKSKHRSFDTVFEPMPLKEEQKGTIVQIMKKVNHTRKDHDFYEMLSLAHNEEDREQFFADSYKELYDTMQSLIKCRKNGFCVCSSPFADDFSKIHTVDYDIQFRLLNNNILLDATASMQPFYEKCKTFDLVQMDRIINYENWNLNVCNVNSSKAKKKVNMPFFRGAMMLAEKICKNPNNRLLIVGSKEDVGNKREKGKIRSLFPQRCEVLKRQRQVEFANFEELRGRNDWSGFNNCLIIHTYYRPFSFYPLLLEYYLPENVIQNDDLVLGNIGKGKSMHYGYRNSKLLDETREGDLSAATYQAIKRINRNNDQSARVYIVSINLNMIKTLKKNMRGIHIKRFQLPNQEEIRNAKKRKHKKEKPIVTDLKTLLIAISEGMHREQETLGKPGYYKKKWIMKMIGYSGTHFSRLLAELENVLEKLEIVANQHDLKILQFAEKD